MSPPIKDIFNEDQVVFSAADLHKTTTIRLSKDLNLGESPMSIAEDDEDTLVNEDEDENDKKSVIPPPSLFK